MTSIKSFGQQIQSFWKSKAEPKSQPEIQKQTAQQAPARPSDQLKTQNLTSGKSAEKIAFVETKRADAKKIDSPAVFNDGNAASAKEIDAVLSHYGSPHAGKGARLVALCKEKNINPILMLAIMQQESSYGNKSNNKSLSDENVANPWSVHFNEPAEGIKKLRLKDGSMPSFEYSLEKAIDIMKRLAGDSSTPLTQAGKRYSTTSSWTNAIKTHYATQLNRINKMR